MIIGVPKEIKAGETRAALIPSSVAEIVKREHTVLIETGAGQGAGINDKEFQEAGAEIVERTTIFGDAEMVLKVKEPVLDEPNLLHEGQLLLTYLH